MTSVGMFPNGDRFLRIKEVAVFLRASEKTVRRLIDERKLRSSKPAGVHLIRYSDLIALIEKKTV